MKTAGKKSTEKYKYKAGSSYKENKIPEQKRAKDCGIKGRLLKKRLYASLTVEAAYIMAVVLMCFAGLFKFGFRIHDEASMNFVLNEGLELAGHSNNADLSEISKRGEDRMRYAMYLKDFSMTLSREGNELTAAGGSDTYRKSMSAKGFSPEKMMRMITLIEKKEQ